MATESDYRAGLGEHLDLIFSDFHLPIFSVKRGLELLRESKLDTPFIVVSGTIGEEQAVDAAEDQRWRRRPARRGRFG